MVGIVLESMSQYQRDNADEMADDYEMGDAEEDMDEEYHGRGMGYSDSDDEEYGESVRFFLQLAFFYGLICPFLFDSFLHFIETKIVIICRSVR